MKCPKCTTEMDEVRKLDVIVDSCSRCGGMWLDAGELDKLRSAAKEARAAGPANVQSHPVSHDDELIGRPGWTRHDSHAHGKRKRKKSVLDLLEIFD